jgi:Ni/Co efflux regulator RcnB
MRKLLIALIAAAFAAVTFGAVAAEQPYTAQPKSEKPGRAADTEKKDVKAGGAMDKPGRAADQEKAAKKNKKAKKKKPEA